MADERYQKIMADLGMPDSRSLLQALQQVANEVAQEVQALEREKRETLVSERDTANANWAGAVETCSQLHKMVATLEGDRDALLQLVQDWKETARAFGTACDTLRAENAKLKTVPMKYRRMEFNAQLQAENDTLRDDVERWRALYRRAINEANGLTNYVEDRPELRRAERNLAAIGQDARIAIDAAMKEQRNG